MKKIIIVSKNLLCFWILFLIFFISLLQSFDRISEKVSEFNEEDEDELNEEEESKFCTLPRCTNGFTIRHVSKLCKAAFFYSHK